MKSFRGILIYTAIVLVVAIVYFIYVYTTYSGHAENETILGEFGEDLGEIGLWLLAIIYGRTLLKLFMGKGPITQRLIPEYYYSPALPLLKRLLVLLNRTHIYVGIAAIAVILLHIALVGMPMEILFFPVVLALIVWQGLFGFFLTWRYSPKELKQFSYLVHAQFLTGITIGIFAFFGHMLVDS